ncbi:TIGR03943 family putative permease subunit [Agreia pratensis]|uniref:TIGR03943 family putative permease subunit n=1 Tax=Agreia pratensis TaxID=150121 RepID=UPI001E319942|nr:TIGR03943 family protein [Agreia pratensis]
MLERILARWQGLALSLIGIVSISWLALTGQLGLYIHPRYFVFTVIMTALGGLLTLAAFAVAPEKHEHEPPDAPELGADQLEPIAARPRWRPLLSLAGIAAIAVAFVALVIVPPSTLTTATVENRELNSSATGVQADTTSHVELAGSDVSSLSLRDWASLLRDGSGSDFVVGKTATLSGFVTADASDPENVFYLTRFVVTCCAVDAQPIGIPVYSPGWSSSYAVDSWVEAKGTFGLNPSAESSESVVLANPTVSAIDQPAEPYAY